MTKDWRLKCEACGQCATAEMDLKRQQDLNEALEKSRREILAEVERLRSALEWIANGTAIIGVDTDGSPLRGHPDKVQLRKRARDALGVKDV